MSHINCFLGLGNPSVWIHQEADAKTGLEMRATYIEGNGCEGERGGGSRNQQREPVECNTEEDYAVTGSQYSFMKISIGTVGRPQPTSPIRTVLVCGLQEQASTRTGSMSRHWLAIIWGSGIPREILCWIPGGDRLLLSINHNPFHMKSEWRIFYGHSVEGKNYR